MTTTKYRAWVHPEHVRSNMTRHLCSWCGTKLELTGVEVDGLLEMACPLATKHVEDQERWAAMSEGGHAE